jgi:hypothetical protein
LQDLVKYFFDFFRHVVIVVIFIIHRNSCFSLNGLALLQIGSYWSAAPLVSPKEATRGFKNIKPAIQKYMKRFNYFQLNESKKGLTYSLRQLHQRFLNCISIWRLEFNRQDGTQHSMCMLHHLFSLPIFEYAGQRWKNSFFELSTIFGKSLLEIKQ